MLKRNGSLVRVMRRGKGAKKAEDVKSVKRLKRNIDCQRLEPDEPPTRVVRRSRRLVSNACSQREKIIIAVCVLLFAVAALAAEEKEFRAARSVHLGYHAPEGLFFYNEVVVEQSVDGSYFMACGWKTGYFGIQQLGGPDDKVVLFSVWDPAKGDDPNAVKTEDRVEVLYEGEGTRIKRFGGEGTGGQCLWRYNWQVGQTNRFLVGAEFRGQKSSYTAWFMAAGGWKKLATFRTRSGGSGLSGYYSFIEDFRRDGKSVEETRRARFGNGWVKTMSGDWVALCEARFTASGAEWESKENINAGVNGGFFFLATGGSIRANLQLRSLIHLAAPRPNPPGLVLDFVSGSGEQ
jgi:hypothetical protein